MLLMFRRSFVILILLTMFIILLLDVRTVNLQDKFFEPASAQGLNNTIGNINTLDATTTFSAESTNTPLKVQAGLGNGTVGVAIQLFSPKQVDIKSGES